MISPQRSAITNKVLPCVIAISILFVSGCSSKSSGDALAATNSAASNSTDSTSGPAGGRRGVGDPGAPQIHDPLSPVKYVDRPCLLLTQKQEQEFSAQGPGEFKGQLPVGEAGCGWTMGADSSVQVGIWFQTSVSDGLDGLYARKQAGRWSAGYFEETQVSGYPAVFAALSDARQRGDCVLNVGVNEKLYFGVLVQAPTDRNGCKAAENLAAAAIHTMKNGE